MKDIKAISKYNTTVTDEEIENGLMDDSGVIYSPDGKRLLQMSLFGRKPKSYTIKDGTEIICDDAFINCKSLESIVLPDSVTHIGDYAFSGCESLKSVIFPNSVTHMGDRVFDCKSLQSIVLPKSVEFIGKVPFSIGIKIESHSNRFVVKDGLLIDLEEKRLIQCISNKKKHIEVPERIESIGDSAFDECESLESIVLPNSITCIGDCAFNGCKSLKCIVLPDSVTTIGNKVFSRCWSLKNIILPKSIEFMGIDPFHRDTKIVSHSDKFIVKDGLLIDLEQKRLIQCISDKEYIEIPDGVALIDDYAFISSDLKSITLPESLTSIGNYAFIDCESLQGITLPNSVTHIGDHAFESCESLKTITLPKSLTSIGDGVFDGCKSLKSVIFPNSVTHIGDYAFESCESLKSITLPESLTSIGDFAFSSCESLQGIVLPKSVEFIGESPFYIGTKIVSHSDRFVVKDGLLIDLKEKRLIQCISNKKHIVVPDGIELIGDHAFCSCRSLQSITLPNSTTSIGYSAF